MTSRKAKPKTIDEYLAGVKADYREALEKLRQTIRAVVPNAEECISYGIPAFRLNGRLLVGFGAWANHCSFYPMSSTTLRIPSALLPTALQLMPLPFCRAPMT